MVFENRDDNFLLTSQVNFAIKSANRGYLDPSFLMILFELANENNARKTPLELLVV
jgi:hypothetical protein